MSYIPVKKRKKKFKGFDFYEDQLDMIEELSKQTKMSQVDILRSALDAQLGLPKEEENENQS